MNTWVVSTIMIAVGIPAFCTSGTTIHAEEPAGTIREAGLPSRVGTPGDLRATGRTQLTDAPGNSKSAFSETSGESKFVRLYLNESSSRIRLSTNDNSGNSIAWHLTRAGRTNWRTAFSGTTVRDEKSSRSIRDTNRLQRSQDREDAGADSDVGNALSSPGSFRIGD